MAAVVMATVLGRVRDRVMAGIGQRGTSDGAERAERDGCGREDAENHGAVLFVEGMSPPRRQWLPDPSRALSVASPCAARHRPGPARDRSRRSRRCAATRWHEAMRELRDGGAWLARAPLGTVVLDRAAGEQFLRTKSAIFPGLLLAQLFSIDRRAAVRADGPQHHQRQRRRPLAAARARQPGAEPARGRALSPGDARDPRGPLAAPVAAAGVRLRRADRQAVPVAHDRARHGRARRGRAAAARLVDVDPAPVRPDRARRSRAARDDPAQDRRVLRLGAPAHRAAARNARPTT